MILPVFSLLLACFCELYTLPFVLLLLSDLLDHAVFKYELLRRWIYYYRYLVVFLELSLKRFFGGNRTDVGFQWTRDFLGASWTVVKDEGA